MVFEPPSSAEAPTTYENRWFFKPRRAPQQQQRANTRILKPLAGADAANTCQNMCPPPLSPRAEPPPRQTTQITPHFANPRGRRGSETCVKHMLASPPSAARRRTLAKTHGSGVPRWRRGSNNIKTPSLFLLLGRRRSTHLRKHMVLESSESAEAANTCEKMVSEPPEGAEAATTIKPQVFEPPEGAEAAHTYEKTWFPRSPRAPGQHMFHVPPPPSPLPPTAPRQQQPSSTRLFEPPDGAEAAHSCEKTWFWSPQRATRQQTPAKTYGH